MKTLSIIAIAGLASAAAADNYLTANAAYGGHAPHARSNYASATMTVAVDYDHWDANLSPNNIVVFIDLNAALGGLAGQDAYVTGIGWDTHIMTVASGSWLSESAYDFAGQIFLSPGAGDSFSGTGDYSSGGIVDLSDNGLPDILAAGGVLSLEMFDSFDDVAAVDSHQSGTLTLVVDYKVPAPAGLAVLGLGGLVATRRRR